MYVSDKIGPIIISFPNLVNHTHTHTHICIVTPA